MNINQQTSDERIISGAWKATEIPSGFFKIDFSIVILQVGLKILVVYNQKRHVWELPGGKLLSGETPEKCGHRELFEETGIIVSHLDLIGALQTKIANSSVRTGYIYNSIMLPNEFMGIDKKGFKLALWDMHSEYPKLAEIDGAIISFFRFQVNK
jgi:8-oxo-dGTP diphosphatase